jgi:hypothetical protein
MNTITVKKDELLDTLRTNRQRHGDKVAQARAKYREKIIEELDRRLAEAKSGRDIDPGVRPGRRAAGVGSWRDGRAGPRRLQPLRARRVGVAQPVRRQHPGLPDLVMSDWRTKADQDLTAQDVAEMRRAASAAAGLYKRGWDPPDPPDELPVAAKVRLIGVVRNDEPHAQLDFYDPVAERRGVQIDVQTALSLQAQLAAFLQQVYLR